MKKVYQFNRTSWLKFILLLFIFSATISGKAQDTGSKTLDSLKGKKKIAVVQTPQQIFTSSCIRCHSIGKGKLVGPDLMGIKLRHDEKWLINFIRNSDSMIKSGDTAATRVYLANGKLPMPKHNINKDQAKSLIDYITSEGNKLKVNPRFLDNSFSYLFHSNNWLLILALYLIIFAIFDLIFTKFIKYKIIHVLIIFVGLGLIGKIITEEAILLGRSPGYEPDQPIKFSHKIHAGENKINCVYCHTGAYDSRYAGIPPASLCLNCHNVIRKGTNTGEKEIAKIHEAIETGKPIQWVKVYTLADFVFFSHAQHVNAGKIECKKCHGDVEKMGRIQQVTDLSMGWCIKCHRETKVNFDNKYYSNYKQHEALKTGKISKVTVQDIGGNNCSKCHY